MISDDPRFKSVRALQAMSAIVCIAAVATNGGRCDLRLAGRIHPFFNRSQRARLFARMRKLLDRPG